MVKTFKQFLNEETLEQFKKKFPKDWEQKWAEYKNTKRNKTADDEG